MNDVPIFNPLPGEIPGNDFQSGPDPARTRVLPGDVPVLDAMTSDEIAAAQEFDAVRKRREQVQVAGKTPGTPEWRQEQLRTALGLCWRGRPIKWTAGRLGLWQALVAPLAFETCAFLDAHMFLFLATHEDGAWELPLSGEVEGKPYSLPPLKSDLDLFRRAIREWADKELGAFEDVNEAAALLMQQCFTAHRSAKALVREPEREKEGADAADPPRAPLG